MELLSIGLIVVLIIACLIIVSVFQKSHQQKEIKRAGNKGESIFNNMLKSILNNEDVLLNNVCLNTDDGKTEIDNLIINKNGIFIIEIKNYNGTLSGGIDDYEWTKCKVTPGDNVYIKKAKNPIRQMKRQIYILSKHLKNNNIWIWINGYVYFVNHNSPVDDECVINDIRDFEQIIHKSQDKEYNKNIINSAINLLSK